MSEKQIGAWQRKLLPFMMAALVVVAMVFFIGTFLNYNSLTKMLRHQDPPIAEAITRASGLSSEAQFVDWYVRATLEERAIAGRQRQYNAIVESRLWTRLMGFLAGMVLVLAGSVFVLGKLEAEFDGNAKTSEAEGSMKTNSPGLVLVVAGTVLLAISLLVTVDVKSEDRLVYLPSFEMPGQQPEGRLVDGAAAVKEIACKKTADPAACMQQK